MTLDQATVFAIIFGAMVMFVLNRIRYDVVGIVALLVAVLSGVVPADEAFAGFGHPAVITVDDAMSPGVYTVSPNAPIDEVVEEMASKKYGSAVVVQNNKVVGIFTTVDVCSAFSALLHSRLR